MEEQVEAVVIKNGSRNIEAGFAGEEAPTSLFPSIVGRPKRRCIMVGMDQKDAYVGDEALSKEGLRSLKYPLEHGFVTNWDDMEKIWHHTFYNELRVAPEEHPVLLTEPPLNPKANRERMTQIMFETFNVPAMYPCVSEVLSLYASGRTTGVVLDSGYEITNCVPIYEGLALKNVVKSARIGGKDLTEYLILCLNERGYAFASNVHLDVLRDMKETLCYVSQDLHQDTKISLESAALEKSYKLPDGTIVTLGTERFKCPEMLFSSNVGANYNLGVQDLLQESLFLYDKEQRPELCESVVLSGGSTSFPGFGQRLKKDFSRIMKHNADMNIVETPDYDRTNLTWIGGSILASLPSFWKMWISKEEYDECGPGLVHRKCK